MASRGSCQYTESVLPRDLHFGGLAGGDVLAHGIDFDGEVGVGGGVKVADGDHACESLIFFCVIDNRDVSDAAIGHQVACFIKGGLGGAGDDFGGHRFGDLGGFGVELGGDDAGEDVAFGDDACEFV